MPTFKTSKLYGLCALFAILTHCGKPDQLIETEDGSQMVLIPAGRFHMGGMEDDLKDYEHGFRDNYRAERPRHIVELSSYYIDKYEVTNAQYIRFFEMLKQEPDSSIFHLEHPPGHAMNQQYMSEGVAPPNHPAIGVSWYNAFAYCRWANKRLPTEAEWEYAARGPAEEYSKYPWGNKPPNADGIWRANYEPEGNADADGYKMTAPVGSYPDGASPFGILDMAGNADEWTADWLGLDYYQLTDGVKNPSGPIDGQLKVVKGGSFYTDSYQIRTATRLYGRRETKSDKLGFRCAKDLNP